MPSTIYQSLDDLWLLSGASSNSTVAVNILNWWNLENLKPAFSPILTISPNVLSLPPMSTIVLRDIMWQVDGYPDCAAGRRREAGAFAEAADGVMRLGTMSSLTRTFALGFFRKAGMSWARILVEMSSS